MFSPRCAAQLGLGAACLVLVSSLTVLHLGASEARRALRGQPLTPAPDFVLSDAAGRTVGLASLRGSVVVLCFRAINCPVSNDYDARLAAFAKRYSGGAANFENIESPGPRVSVFSINVGPGHPTAGAYKLPCLLDPSGEVAERYAVEVTPTFFVIDASGQIRYRGSFDDNRNDAQAEVRYCRDALESIMHGEPVGQPLTAPFGCILAGKVREALAR